MDEDGWVTVNYRFRAYHFTIGKVNLRWCLKGPGD
jgi:hypothetical protein